MDLEKDLNKEENKLRNIMLNLYGDKPDKMGHTLSELREIYLQTASEEIEEKNKLSQEYKEQHAFVQSLRDKYSLAFQTSEFQIFELQNIMNELKKDFVVEEGNYSFKSRKEHPRKLA